MTQDFIEEESLQTVLQLLYSVWDDQSNSDVSGIDSFTPEIEIPLLFSESENEILSQAKINGFSIFKIINPISPGL